jgi:trimethylamine--corrinoid protein Co-methyltransferase
MENNSMGVPEGKLRLKVLTENDSRAIHQTALKILAEIGMRILDRDTVGILIDRGCRITDDGYVLFDEETIARALSSVPSRMVLYDRNGEIRIDTEDPIPRFGPGINCLNILDYQTGRHRPCRLSDISKTARVCEQLSHIDWVQSLGSPGDVSPEEEALATVRAMVAQTGKPIGFTGHDETEAARIWAYLAELAGSRQALAQKPFAMELTGPISPLKLAAETCKRLRYAAARHLPVAYYPGLFPGASGPMTLAGSLAQCAAEVLAGIVVHQLESPGAPLLTGSAVIPMNMRSGSLAYGSPQFPLACLAQVDYFTDIGIPTWSSAGSSDAHRVDAQAAAEAGRDMFCAALAGTAFIQGLGRLSAGKTGSLEMLILCDELAGTARRVAAGVPVNRDTLAFDVVERGAKSGSYLQDDHTLSHVRTESWTPSLFDQTDLDTWRESGSTEMRARIHEKLRELLDE